MFEVDEKIVLITGASSGIGLHLCETFACRGARVIACSRSAEQSKGLLHLATGKGLDVTPLAMDVTNPASVAEAMERVRGRVGRIDVLVNSAGTARPIRLLDMSTEAWDETLDTNLKGPFLVSRAVVPLMPDGASIINISSIGAFRAITGLSSYAAAKSGLLMLSRALALELASRRIRSNVVAPGYVLTPMNEDFLASEQGERLRGKIPLKRFATVTDLDGAMIFLASDASSYMTGGCLLLDGGFLL
ncbi:NAD(P)-dependent dehydrogenase (short-subunit alcohol dehydrogenase family) [Rhodoligotrophos appendicifer]|uniref:SDR family NAD(P)-dependent oxidoreductase n=1 Tax=Rhodoligotrophos appendicifer TaxID=987056 RepID=UPI001187097A|nr:SDR family oxidoreductase [Rhodoligotrophos appendicifer]